MVDEIVEQEVDVEGMSDEEIDILIADTEEELRRRGLLDDVKKEEFENTVPLIKSEEERKVWAVVLEPDSVDAQGDRISGSEITKAAHRWLEKYKELGLQHIGDGNPDIQPVESYIAPTDFMLGDQLVRKGSWVMAAHINNDKIWEGIKSGELNGFSIQGWASRRKVANVGNIG